jgi:hypothetical protein
MEQPKDQTEFNPSSSPFNQPAARYTYLKHPEAGLLMVDSRTQVVTPMKDQPYPGYPLELPPALMAVKQKFIRTCGVPEKDGNMGCEAAVNGGCAILNHYGRIGPRNMIVVRNGKVDSCKCHHFYCGISDSGRPTSQAHMQLDGWEILTDRTRIPQNIVNEKTGMLEEVETEVPNLAPFYEEAKVGRFATPPPAPIRRGRKPGSKNKPKVANADYQNIPAT